jgi:integrase
MSRKEKEPVPVRMPKVRLAFPSGRPIQLRYYCPIEGKEIRISTGTRDHEEALVQLRRLEAKLTLGLPARVEANGISLGPNMEWEDFREQYRTLHLDSLRDKSAQSSESRLDVCAEIIKPKTISDIFNNHKLQILQAALKRGECSRRNKPRSPNTVDAYMATMLAAFNWAFEQGWLEEQPRFRKRKQAKSPKMKGRPLTEEEFKLLLDSVELVVGSTAKESWTHLIRGLWQSGLRLDEIMNVSWDIPNTITPEWPKGKFPILKIPAAMQKNDTEEDIPLLPWFEALLLETPAEGRTGWVFNPISLQTKIGRRMRHGRFDAEWIGKVISRIGKKAGIEVKPEVKETGAPTKFVSAHDLRRSFGQRLLEAGVPPLVISRVLRHSSWETTKAFYVPGNVQKDAEVLRRHLEKVED